MQLSAPVDVEQSDGVQIITINRPEVRNAINTETAVAIGAALDELDERADLVAGVITGAGETFCTGMDLNAFLAGERPSVEGRGFAGITEQSSNKPLIAAVEGHAVAGGFEIVLACDLIVASETAVFGLPEVKRGLLAGGGGLLRLPRKVPHQRAVEWSLTGDYFSAQTAADADLLNRLVPAGQAATEAIALATRIARNGPLAVRATKQIIASSRDWSGDEEFARMREVYEPVRSSEDAREGALAFKEKRDPVWKGR